MRPMSVSLSSALVKRRGRVLLGPIDLALEGAGTTIVLGPNGAGKTTLLKVLHGVERLSSGTLDWSVPKAQAREAQAYVFQKPIMLRRSVGQNLAYPLKLLGVEKAAISARVQDWAARIGLAEALDLPATRLSGGEQQKLALARALIRAPQVLFLDEPCAYLDGRATREIEEMLNAAAQAGMRIIMSTHDLGQARRLAREVVFLVKGTLREQGAADAFFAAPQTAEARAFLSGEIVE